MRIFGSLLMCTLFLGGCSQSPSNDEILNGVRSALRAARVCTQQQCAGGICDEMYVGGLFELSNVELIERGEPRQDRSFPVRIRVQGTCREGRIAPLLVGNPMEVNVFRDEYGHWMVAQSVYFGGTEVRH